ncbi:MAG: prephenate dehydrogenase, partial [Caldanaerobacter sp.]
MIEKVAVVGLGLIGGSIAKALRKYTDIDVIGVDVDTKTLDKALREGTISEAFREINFALEVDVLFICTPVGKIADNVKNIYPHLKKGCIITDVGSTKKVVMEEIEKFLPLDFYFIGGHPMAGTEKAGYDYSHPDLFVDSFYFLVPSDSVEEGILEIFVKEIIKKIGAKPVIVDYNEHDRIVGVISHVPHIISTTLSNFAHRECKDALKYAAGGFKDTTRIALSQTEMW